jgi:tetratricopeptide (TPR) repeat protein
VTVVSVSDGDAFPSDLGARLIPSRAVAVWFVLYAVIGLVACFVPLFDRVGYESAALFGLVAGLVVPFLTLHAYHIGDISSPATPGQGAGARDFGRLAIRHLSMLVVPVALLAANALRVQTCDFETGFAFWLAIPVVTTLLAQTTGWCIAGWRSANAWHRYAAVGLFIAATVGWFLWRLAMQPPITGHQWLIGYFSGSIYDEALSLPWSLVYYRAFNLLFAGAALALVAAASAVQRSGSFDIVSRGRLWWGLGGASILLLTCALGWTYAPDNGVGLTRDYITEQLGGRLETEHFVIHYPQTERFTDQRAALAEDHEFRYREMKAFFDTDPASDTKIHSFVYRNRDQKAKLMGGRRTMVARIWLKEMHILWPRYGHHLLAHELAHVFTYPFGSGPLRLSADMWVGVNMGLVEGIATAADWPVDEMTPHQAAAALRQVGLAPDLRGIIGAGGFWTSASSRAYTLTGSFLRFLRERYGIEQVKAAYGTGDFRPAFGKSADTLITEWEAYLRDVELDEGTLELVRYLYRRPSIFAKVCPRTIGKLKQRARVAAARGDLAEAKRIYDQVVGFAPKNVDFQLEYAELLLQHDAIESAIARLNAVRERRDLAAVHRAHLLEVLGDARWHQGEIASARDAYQSCLQPRLPAGKERFNRVKLASLSPERTAVRSLAFHYLVKGADSGVGSFFPMEWARRRPEDALGAYLVGRRLWGARLWKQSTRYLQDALDNHGLPESLRPETRRLLARSSYFSDKVSVARRAFEKLRKADRARYRWEAREWLERLDFRRDSSTHNSPAR